MKHYSAMIIDNSLTVAYDSVAFLKNLRLRLNLEGYPSRTFVPTKAEEADGEIHVSFRRDPYDPWEREAYPVLLLREVDSLLVFGIKAPLDGDYVQYSLVYRADESVALDFEYAEENAETVSEIHDLFWMGEQFGEGMKNLNPYTDTMLFHMGETHYHLLPLSNDTSTTRLDKEGAKVYLGEHNLSNADTEFLTVSAAKTPYDAVNNTFSLGQKAGTVRVELRKDRKFPELFEGFGWCTWNAFYADVSAEGIYKKLDELREKKIPLRWVLIDDGWSIYTDRDDRGEKKLLSFREDRTKFPEGLKGCIDKIKNEYGIPYVGIWHAFTGFWNGISPDSEIVRDLPKSVTVLPTGQIVPALDEEGAFLFWDTWHSYLESCGVDFVKVDNQGSFPSKYRNNISEGKGMAGQFRALEKSVDKHFGGAMINCMGSLMNLVQNRHHSPLNRNSNDFYPGGLFGFQHHLFENAYAALFEGPLTYCDYDMWWSIHPTAMQSAVLRAVSGGPIYVSDEVGKSDATYIKPLCNEEGVIYRCDDHAIPTLDCLYKSAFEEKKPFKVFNRKGDKFVLCAFGVSEEMAGDGEFRIEQIPAMHGEYVAVEFLSGKATRFDAAHPVKFVTKNNEVALFNVYPIDKNGCVTLGRDDKYVAVATEAGRTVKVDELLK